MADDGEGARGGAGGGGGDAGLEGDAGEGDAAGVEVERRVGAGRVVVEAGVEGQDGAVGGGVGEGRVAQEPAEEEGQAGEGVGHVARVHAPEGDALEEALEGGDEEALGVGAGDAEELEGVAPGVALGAAEGRLALAGGEGGPFAQAGEHLGGVLGGEGGDARELGVGEPVDAAEADEVVRGGVHAQPGVGHLPAHLGDGVDARADAPDLPQRLGVGQGLGGALAEGHFVEAEAVGLEPAVGLGQQGEVGVALVQLDGAGGDVGQGHAPQERLRAARARQAAKVAQRPGEERGEHRAEVARGQRAEHPAPPRAQVRASDEHQQPPPLLLRRAPAALDEEAVVAHGVEVEDAPLGGGLRLKDGEAPALFAGLVDEALEGAGCHKPFSLWLGIV